jgi:hypothetical protein
VQLPSCAASDFFPAVRVSLSCSHLLEFTRMAARQDRVPEGQIQTPGFAVLDLRGGYDFTGKLTVSTRYSGTSGSCTPTRRRHAIIPHLSSAGRLSGEAGIPHTWPHFPARAARSLTGRGIHLASRICLYAQGPMISRQNPIDLILSPQRSRLIAYQ